MMWQGQSRRQSASVPAEQSVALTEPRPFHLRSEERGKAKQALLAQRLETQRKQVRRGVCGGWVGGGGAGYAIVLIHLFCRGATFHLHR